MIPHRKTIHSEITIEPCHEIMALFVLGKFILQMLMHNHPVGLDVWFLVGLFIYFHPSCVRTAKALARLRRCTGLPQPSLVAYVVSTIISWAGSNILQNILCQILRTCHFTCSCTLLFGRASTSVEGVRRLKSCPQHTNCTHNEGTELGLVNPLSG